MNLRPNFILIDTGSRGQQRSYSALARWCVLVLSLKRTAGKITITSIFLDKLDADDSVLGLLPESMPELCRSWDFPPSLKTSRSRTWWVCFWCLVIVISLFRLVPAMSNFLFDLRAWCWHTHSSQAMSLSFSLALSTGTQWSKYSFECRWKLDFLLGRLWILFLAGWWSHVLCCSSLCLAKLCWLEPR